MTVKAQVSQHIIGQSCTKTSSDQISSWHDIAKWHISIYFNLRTHTSEMYTVHVKPYVREQLKGTPSIMPRQANMPHITHNLNWNSTRKLIQMFWKSSWNLNGISFHHHKTSSVTHHLFLHVHPKHWPNWCKNKQVPRLISHLISCKLSFLIINSPFIISNH